MLRLQSALQQWHVRSAAWKSPGHVGTRSRELLMKTTEVRRPWKYDLLDQGLPIRSQRPTQGHLGKVQHVL